MFLPESRARWVKPRPPSCAAYWNIGSKNSGSKKTDSSRDDARFYSHILPSFRAQTFDALEVCGEGWAMIGDSAGLVDPITGEGLYYALRSAELCASAWLAGRPDDYRTRLEEEVLSELKLAARALPAFLQRTDFRRQCSGADGFSCFTKREYSAI